jgi:hypothetical protein
VAGDNPTPKASRPRRPAALSPFGWRLALRAPRLVRLGPERSGCPACWSDLCCPVRGGFGPFPVLPLALLLWARCVGTL